MLATVSSLLASPGAKKGRREAPVSLGMGRDASHRTQRCCGLARTLVHRGEPPPTPPAQGGGEDPKDTMPLGDPICHPPPQLKELPQAPAPRGAPRWVCPLGSGQGSDTVHPGGEPTGRYGYSGNAAGTAPARLGWPRECHVPRMGTMALAPSLNPQGPSAGHRAHGGPGPAPAGRGCSGAQHPTLGGGYRLVRGQSPGWPHGDMPKVGVTGGKSWVGGRMGGSPHGI